VGSDPNGAYLNQEYYCEPQRRKGAKT
jgi:hypothetical protein